MNKQELKDLLAVTKACKTEEEAERAGILIGQEELQRRFTEIGWFALPVLTRSEDDKLGFGGTIPAKHLPNGEKEPLPCSICNQQIEIGQTYKVKGIYIVHNRCLQCYEEDAK